MAEGSSTSRNATDAPSYPPDFEIREKGLFGSMGPSLNRPREYYSQFDKLPRDASQWTDEQKQLVSKLLAEGKLRPLRHKDVLERASKIGNPLAAGLVGVTGGAFVGFLGSALQNAIQTHNHGWKGVFTRTGGTIGAFALAGGIYGSVDAGLKQYRKKADAKNKFAAGCAAGFMIGMQRRSLPMAVGSCVALGTPVAILEMQGGSLRGDGKFEHTTLAGQQAQRYSTIFRKPPMTQTEVEEHRRMLNMTPDEATEALEKKRKFMTPALRAILEEKASQAA